MSHPAHFGEAERIIRYQAQQKDQDWLHGSTEQQVSTLGAMYENYFDASKHENIQEFKIMKSVDECLERKLNHRKQQKQKFETMADETSLMLAENSKISQIKHVPAL